VRLDHLLSKECYWRLLGILLEGISPITTQLNTGYSVALALPADDLAAFDEEWSTQRCCRFVPFESKPAFHGPVPACASGLLLFRFEGVAPTARPVRSGWVGGSNPW
jgi:hypothetical protein